MVAKFHEIYINKNMLDSPKVEMRCSEIHIGL